MYQHALADKHILWKIMEKETYFLAVSIHNCQIVINRPMQYMVLTNRQILKKIGKNKDSTDVSYPHL